MKHIYLFPWIQMLVRHNPTRACTMHMFFLLWVLERIFFSLLYQNISVLISFIFLPSHYTQLVLPPFAFENKNGHMSAYCAANFPWSICKGIFHLREWVVKKSSSLALLYFETNLNALCLACVCPYKFKAQCLCNCKSGKKEHYRLNFVANIESIMAHALSPK